MAGREERYQALVRWIEGAGGQLHPAVEIYHDHVTKGSFRVKEAGVLGSDEEIVSLPLSCSLSFLNAVAGHPGIAATPPPTISAPRDGVYFPAEFLGNVPPHVVGRFFLVQEYLRGEHSHWWPYIRTLPPPEHMADMLPVVWPTSDAEFLRGTNAYVAVQEIRSTLKKEYKQAMKFLPERFQCEYTRPLYYWAYCIFTTRSFRPSLIIPDAGLLSLPCKIDDFSILLPLFDIGNHSPLAKTTWVTDEDSRTCVLRSSEPYSATQQVYNNYGMKTNAELLLGYGFIFPEGRDFHNDYVHIKTRANPAGASDLNASHIVALRPFSHPSSVVGRSRLLDPGHLSCLTNFSHFQDSLIAALYESIARHKEEASDATLTEIMQGKIPQMLLEEIFNSLGTKLTIDLEEIELHDPPYEAMNQNQEMALRYRGQCKKALEYALASLSNIEPGHEN
ncbi:SET domain-containing protein [Xylaria sp. FL1042]|nr:SET domain-containing protein [Xylaria sp. FL1042]